MASQAQSPSALRACLGRFRPAFLLGTLALTSAAGTFADALVEIPDAVLRQCVENTLAKEGGAELTQDDMEELTVLADCNGVSNLGGLEFATNLRELSSREGGIVDLSPLSGLVGLWTLHLAQNPIEDLAPLAGVESLHSLTLEGTDIADLAPVTALPSLRHLDVSGTKMREIPHWPLAAPLHTLHIGDTNVRDLSPLAALTQLRTLGLSDSDLSDIDLTVLTHLPSLDTLFLQGATNVHLHALSGLRNLTTLYMSNAAIVGGLSSLANHRSLRVLNIGGIGLRTLDAIPLSVLASLEDVRLAGNLIKEIKPLLHNGGRLRRVNLTRNPWLSRTAVETDIPALMAKGVEVLHDSPTGQRPEPHAVHDPALRRALLRHLVSPFSTQSVYVYETSVPAERLARILTLALSNEGIASLQGMEHAESLSALWLSGNNISDISPLADLPLLVLALDGNPIGDFGPLVEMEELKYLALDNTSLREIPPLPLALEHLSLADNSIFDLGPLDPLEYTLLELWLGGNSISSLASLQKGVRFLHLNDNEVTDLAGPDLTVLEELHIRNNALRDISPLLDASLLRMLDAQRNPLDEEALAVAETLRERGAAVLTGEAVPFLPAAAATREGLVRVVNRSAEAGAVFVEAWDDAGVRFGPVRLRVNGRGAVHFTSTDLQSGNAGLGLTGIGPPTSGDWRLALTSPLDIEVLSYIRTADGFLTPMHDVATDAILPTLNPASNATRRSVLRLVNRDVERTKVVVGGYDDRGTWEQMPRAIDVLRGQAWTSSAETLENEMGLGDGLGKWRLRVPGWPWLAMSLLECTSGHLTNVSSVPDNMEEMADGQHRHHVPLLPATDGRDGLVRVVNLGGLGGEVLIEAVDDAGARRGPLRLQLNGRQTVNFNTRDLEQGNADKGLTGATGAGGGDWRLTLASSLDLQVLSYVRTADGFLAAMHDVAPVAADGAHRVSFFNPGSNTRQQSKLRLLNDGTETVSATVTGIDDAGQASTTATLRVPAGAALTVTAAQLETGGEGVSGLLGDGEGRWRLRLVANGPLTVMNLLESPEGHLANMSTSTRTD